MDLAERPGAPFRRHPWEVARSRFFQRVIRAHGADRAASVLDVGAGDGWFSAELAASLAHDAAVTCWDVGYTEGVIATLAGASERRVSFVSERPSAAFDLVLLLDVLEHVDDDAGFLGAIVRLNVRRGGAVLVSVPAWQMLFTEHDTRLRHHRRYAPSACASLLTRAGLRIEQSGGLFHSLLVPRAIARAMEHVRKGAKLRDETAASLEWRAGNALGTAVDWALAIDNEVSFRASRTGVALPGLSWWALCRVG
jgi:SAM-dependent methyltransferase